MVFPSPRPGRVLADHEEARVPCALFDIPPCSPGTTSTGLGPGPAWRGASPWPDSAPHLSTDIFREVRVFSCLQEPGKMP